jgi:excisionase family DNA binding protein
LDFCVYPNVLSNYSGSSEAAKEFLLEITMSHLAFNPARKAQVREMTFEQLLDSDEAAALLKIHPKTLQKMARNGEVPGFQIGDLWRFRASALNEWLAAKVAS